MINYINKRFTPILLETAELEIGKFSTIVINKAIAQVLEDKIAKKISFKIKIYIAIITACDIFKHIFIYPGGYSHSTKFGIFFENESFLPCGRKIGSGNRRGRCFCHSNGGGCKDKCQKLGEICV